MTINNSQIAYKIGFSSGFESNSNEILQRRRYKIADLSARELKKVLDAFHRGYFECQQLIHRVNIDNSFKNPWSKLNYDKVPENIINEVKPAYINSDNIVSVLDDLIEYTDLIKRINILIKQGYSGFSYCARH